MDDVTGRLQRFTVLGRILPLACGVDHAVATLPLMRIVVCDAGLGRALRDAGHEVVYLGPEHTPEQVVAIAAQEDVDLIALADHGLHAELVTLMERAGVDDIDARVFAPDQARALR